VSARGFAAIGLHRPKDRHNIGGVLRAAQCYDAASIAISGERVAGNRIKSATNTMQTHRHIPVLRGELRDLIPYGAVPVAVDLLDDAESLPDFEHPCSAFYVFGPEDGTLGKDILEWCPRRVMVPTQFCMNLAATVNVILYDRLAKRQTPHPGLLSPTGRMPAQDLRNHSREGSDGPLPVMDEGNL
jgi:tRNA(Leu) C34 or U34 (ribose-2'-O)-methylase TrmL